VLKGKKIPREVQAIEDDDLIVSANSSAWINEETFLQWIQKVWRPHATNHARNLLIMDRFRVHEKESALKVLEEVNTDVLFIPRGLTFYLQPCDVYINKVVKERIRQLWLALIARQAVEMESGIV